MFVMSVVRDLMQRFLTGDERGSNPHKVLIFSWSAVALNVACVLPNAAM